MFNNIGNKIKAVAKTFNTIINIIGVIVALVFFALFVEEIGVLVTLVICLIIIAVHVLIAWLSNILLYGYGQLIENSDKIAEKLCGNTPSQNIRTDSAVNTADTSAANTAGGKIGKCDFCNKEGVSVTEYKIDDSFGTRYRNMCDDCIKKYNSNN